MACRDSTNFITFISVSFRDTVHMGMFRSTLLRSFCLSPYIQGERIIIQKLHACRKTKARELIDLGHTRKCYLQIR